MNSYFPHMNRCYNMQFLLTGKEDGECLSGDLTAISTLLQNESSSIESPQLNVTNIYRACPPYIEQLVNLTEVGYDQHG